MAQLTNKEIEQIKSILRQKSGPKFNSTKDAAKQMQQILKMSEKMYGPKKSKTSLELKKALKGMK